MEINSLNSLAEVGIGINLAFGSIGAVRDFFVNHVKNGVNDCSSAIKTCLSESNNDNASANALHLDDILEIFKEKTSKVSLYMVWAAFICASILIILLYKSAVEPCIIIDPLWALLVLFVVCAPVSVMLFLQCCYWIKAKQSLNKLEKDMDTWARMNKKVMPLPPE